MTETRNLGTALTDGLPDTPGMAVLLGPQLAAEALAEARRRLENRLSRSRRTTAAYGQGCRRVRPDSGEEAWAEAADLMEVLQRRKQELREAQERLKWLLAAMAAEGGKGPRNAALLEQRYLLGRGWTLVREAMAEEGFPAGTERTLFNWHREAVAMAEKIMA